MIVSREHLSPSPCYWGAAIAVKDVTFSVQRGCVGGSPTLKSIGIFSLSLFMRRFRSYLLLIGEDKQTTVSNVYWKGTKVIHIVWFCLLFFVTIFVCFCRYPSSPYVSMLSGDET